MSCDVDEGELCLDRRELHFVPDLSKFLMLRCVWLNNNKIRDICDASFNCCLTEIHLQNNSIISISGALRHLSCLRVLLLHNNQIKHLEETVAELRHMQDLHTLSLYLNPLTQNPQYRLYVVHHLPSLQLLDIKDVKLGERRQAFKIFCTERQRVLDSIAFGRRALPTPLGKKATKKITKLSSQEGKRNRPSEIRPTGNTIVQVRTMNWSGTGVPQWNKVKTQANAGNTLTVKPR